MASLKAPPLVLISEAFSYPTSSTCGVCLGVPGAPHMTTTTFLKIKQLPMRYVDLARRMRECVRTLGERGTSLEAGVNGGGCSPQAAAAAPGALELWFLFVARISVLDAPEDEEMLVAATGRVLRAMGLSGANWGQVREVLRALMWVDWLHSEGGKAFWEVVSSAGDAASLSEEGVLEKESWGSPPLSGGWGRVR